MTPLFQTSAVAIGGRAVLIQGAPGSGKSSLALALIERGATLIGDDGISIAVTGRRLIASPPPHTAGLIELRNIGLLSYPTTSEVPVALVVRLDTAARRFIDAAQSCDLCGIVLPLVHIWPEGPLLALKTEAALERYGAPFETG